MRFSVYVFFFNDTATTEIYTLSLHDALPISLARTGGHGHTHHRESLSAARAGLCPLSRLALLSHPQQPAQRSEEHTSELQSHSDLVCRLLLEIKKYTYVG